MKRTPIRSRPDLDTALAERYRNDPELLAFYRKKLLQPGWAGRLDPVEKAYVRAHASWVHHGPLENLRNRPAHVSNARPQRACFGEAVWKDLETDAGG